jgi:hypothetical protein
MDCCFGRKDYAVTGYDVNLIRIRERGLVYVTVKLAVRTLSNALGLFALALSKLSGRKGLRHQGPSRILPTIMATWVVLEVIPF